MFAIPSLLKRTPAEPEKPRDPQKPGQVSPRKRWGSRFGHWMINWPIIHNRVPARYRPTLYLETLYNIGSGAFVSLFLLTPVVLKTIVDGTELHLMLLGVCFGGSSLFSPVVSLLSRWFSMRSLVVFPNLIVAALLLATALDVQSATLFTLIVGGGFLARVFPRVAEMNMYRINYPATHRGAAVGWTKAVSAISGLAITLLGYWWFSFQPNFYWLMYCLVGVLLVGATYVYSRIPMHRNNLFNRGDSRSAYGAFWDGLKVFLSDRRFLLYQFGFWLAGFANHMSLVFIVEVLTEDVIAERSVQSLLPETMRSVLFVFGELSRQTVVSLIVGLVFAVVPALLMMASAPFWGRFLDRSNPMIGRAIFNSFQAVAYALHAYGGLTLQIWPFVVGAALHAIGNGGGTINWLTGSLYFARTEHVSLYNAIHVALTGLRGILAPICGWYLISSSRMNLGAGLFWVAAAMSVLGVVVMLYQGLTDPGPRESQAA